MVTGGTAADTGLDGKKALVVGAYGGMGSAIATALAREGVACAVMGRNRERLTETAKACVDAGTPATTVVCDIARTAAIEGAVQHAVQALAGMNYLINCAGAHELAKGQDADLATWDHVLDVNLRATYHLARYALPEINKSPGGAVIKIGSVASSYSGAGAFLATTRGLDGYADALFEDVREYGTKVCVIKPGFVNTPLVATDRLNPARMIQPADIARTVLFVLNMPATACPTEITIRPQRSPYLKT